MSLPIANLSTGTLEECLDDLHDLLGMLERYPQEVLAMALRTHLGALLHAMQMNAACTPAEVREFLAQLARESGP